MPAGQCSAFLFHPRYHDNVPARFFGNPMETNNATGPSAIVTGGGALAATDRQGTMPSGPLVPSLGTIAPLTLKGDVVVVWVCFFGGG